MGGLSWAGMISVYQKVAERKLVMQFVLPSSQSPSGVLMEGLLYQWN